MKEEFKLQFKKIAFEDIQSPLIIKGIDCTTPEFAHSHSPYSNFKVIASIIYEDGEVVVAANQENVAFPSGICAEANVLSTIGARKVSKKIKAIVVRAFVENDQEVEFISPCGNCRQIMLEFERRHKEEIEVYFGSKKAGFYLFKSCQDLLPLFFSEDSFE